MTESIRKFGVQENDSRSLDFHCRYIDCLSGIFCNGIHMRLAKAKAEVRQRKSWSMSGDEKMKYIIGIYHTLYLQYIGLFGGEVKNKKFYILFTIYLNDKKEISFDTCHFIGLRKLKNYFVIYNAGSNNIESYFKDRK